MDLKITWVQIEIRDTYLLLFGDKSVVLSDPLKGQLFHEIDFVRVLHVLFHEDLNFNLKL